MKGKVMNSFSKLVEERDYSRLKEGENKMKAANASSLFKNIHNEIQLQTQKFRNFCKKHKKYVTD